MGKSTSFIQWNCRGIKGNYEELKSLLYDNKPIAVCLQETLLKDSDNISFKGYDIYNKTVISPADGRATGGSSILVRKDTPHKLINLDSPLQAVAVTISTHKTISICSVYIPPRSAIVDKEIDNLLNQLPSPILLLGDFNAHSEIWGCNDLDDKGRKLEDLCTRHDFCILNDKSHTYIHPATGTFSAIDISICSPSIFMDLKWNVGKDQCGSDHYPIFIHSDPPTDPEKPPKWLLHRANWDLFELLCSTDINCNTFKNVDSPLEKFSTCLMDIASASVPKSSAVSKHIQKPWFNKECEKAVKDRKNALHKFTMQPTQDNFAKYRAARAKARKVIKENKRKSWRDYVSKLNMKSSVKKTWDMVRKISGRPLSNSTVYVVKQDGDVAKNKYEIADTLAEEFERNSSSEHYSENFQRLKNIREKKISTFSQTIWKHIMLLLVFRSSENLLKRQMTQP